MNASPLQVAEDVIESSRLLYDGYLGFVAGKITKEEWSDLARTLNEKIRQGGLALAFYTVEVNKRLNEERQVAG